MNPPWLQLLKKLIDIDSTQGREKSVGEWTSKFLEGKGYRIQHQAVDEDRFNVFAARGNPLLVFTTHMDTVNGFIPFSEDSQYVYGRGACDAKGIMTAQIIAGEKLIAEGIHQIGFLFVVGEENASDGAKAANALPNACRYLIGGEPTGNKIAVGSKGALSIHISTHGRSAHSAYPEKGESAVIKLLDILHEIRNRRWPVHPVLGPTDMNIGVISGGIQANVIPDRASAEIMFRNTTAVIEVKDQLDGLVGTKGEWQPAFECDPLFLETVDGFESTVVSFTSDLPLLSNWGKPFLLGPGSILDAHIPDEKISKAEVDRGIQLYYQLAKKLMNQPGIVNP